MVASLIWYKQFRSDIEKEVLNLNHYNIYVANIQVNGKKHTLWVHKGNLMSRQVGKTYNNKFDVWLNKTYGRYGKVKTTCVHLHNSLKFTSDLSGKDKVNIDMIDYMNSTGDDFPIKFNPNETSPYPETGYFSAVGNIEDLRK